MNSSNLLEMDIAMMRLTIDTVPLIAKTVVDLLASIKNDVKDVSA